MPETTITLEKPADAVETRRGTCPICGVGCFVEARIANNVPLSIRPDRTAGFPADCPRAGQAIDYHDHPQRLNHPMKRVGARGEGKWERISWDQALDEIAAKLVSIRDRFGPEAVQTMGGSYKGAGDASCWRWSNLWGTPNILYQGKNCGEAELLAEWAVYGDQACIGNQPVPGVTKALILWGVGGAMSLVSQRKNLKAYREAGGKLIVIDPRATDLTEMADIWLQLRPGSDGALAYGMLNVIIAEKLYDADFVRDWCTGFDELAEMVRPFTPERVGRDHLAAGRADRRCRADVRHQQPGAHPVRAGRRPSSARRPPRRCSARPICARSPATSTCRADRSSPSRRCRPTSSPRCTGTR